MEAITEGTAIVWIRKKAHNEEQTDKQEEGHITRQTQGRFGVHRAPRFCRACGGYQEGARTLRCPGQSRRECELDAAELDDWLVHPRIRAERGRQGKIRRGPHGQGGGSPYFEWIQGTDCPLSPPV